jgi:hypothetical protein
MEEAVILYTMADSTSLGAPRRCIIDSTSLVAPHCMALSVICHLLFVGDKRLTCGFLFFNINIFFFSKIWCLYFF